MIFPVALIEMVKSHSAHVRAALLDKLRALAKDPPEVVFPELYEDLAGDLDGLSLEHLWARLAQQCRVRASTQLSVGTGGAWFSVGDRPAISLHTRTTLKAILWSLSALHADARASIDALAEAAWPGSGTWGDSAAVRVYQAIRSLRKLGLPIGRDGRGYYFDNGLRVVIVSESQATDSRD